MTAIKFAVPSFSGSVNSLIRSFLKVTACAKTRIQARIESSPLTGIMTFNALLPFGRAPAHMMVAKKAPARVPFVNKVSTLSCKNAGRFVPVRSRKMISKVSTPAPR